jgi:hypothetical protein
MNGQSFWLQKSAQNPKCEDPNRGFQSLQVNLEIQNVPLGDGSGGLKAGRPVYRQRDYRMQKI